MSIKKILMERDNMSEMEALELIEEAKEVMNDYIILGDLENAYNICQEYFNLEPDYIMELI